MPAWLEEQRSKQRRKSRDAALVGGAGLAGAGGYEAYALTRRPGRSVVRNTATSVRAAGRARGYQRESSTLSDLAQRAKKPAEGTYERKMFDRFGAKAAATQAPYPKGFDPDMFRSRLSTGQISAYQLTRGQARALGMSGAEYDAARMNPNRMLGPEPSSRAQMRAAGLTYGADDAKLRAWQRATNAQARGRFLDRYERTTLRRMRNAGRQGQEAMLNRWRGGVQAQAAQAGRRAATSEALSRHAARNAAKGGWRMGLATAGAAGTAAAGLAGMRAWQRRNAKKASALPKPSWASLSDDERKKAIGSGATRRPVGAIGTPGRAGRYA